MYTTNNNKPNSFNSTYLNTLTYLLTYLLTYSLQAQKCMYTLLVNSRNKEDKGIYSMFADSQRNQMWETFAGDAVFLFKTLSNVRGNKKNNHTQ